MLQNAPTQAGFLMQVSKAASSESLEQGRVSDSNQVGAQGRMTFRWTPLNFLVALEKQEGGSLKKKSSQLWALCMSMGCGCVSEPWCAEGCDAESQPV